jgi:hypothetical protein
VPRDDEFYFADDRHRDLARSLSVPSFVVGAGFRYVSRGELPAGLEEDALMRVGPVR